MSGLTTSTPVDRATLLRKHYNFQQGCFVSEHEESGGGILAFSTVTPIPMWNHATWIEGTDSEFGAFLDHAKEWQQAKDRRPVLYIAEATPAQKSVVQAAGFERFDEEAWMVCKLHETQHSTDDRAIEVTDSGTLQQFIEAFSASFQIKEAGYRSTLSASPQ